MIQRRGFLGRLLTATAAWFGLVKNNTNTEIEDGMTFVPSFQTLEVPVQFVDEEGDEINCVWFAYFQKDGTWNCLQLPKRCSQIRVDYDPDDECRKLVLTIPGIWNDSSKDPDLLGFVTADRITIQPNS